MAATIYGIGEQEWRARPDFTARRDERGGWSGSNSFTMLREVWENYARDQFSKGTPITSVYEGLNRYWSFLVLEGVEVSHQAGAVTLVRCEWTGVMEREEGDDLEGEEEIYTLSGTRVDRSILLHPLYRKEVADNTEVFDQDRASVAATWAGKWQIQTQRENNFKIYYLVSTSDMGLEMHISNREVIKWLRVILEQGIKTYSAPTLQWTVEKTTKDGWQDADLDKLGLQEFDKADRPPGDPPMPVNGDYVWMKVSMQQTKTDGKTRQSQSWELSPAGGLHKFLEPDQDQGLYEYDLEKAKA